MKLRTSKYIRYSLAILIGIILLLIAVFDNTHYASVRSKAFLITAGIVIIVFGILRIVALRKAPKDEEA